MLHHVPSSDAWRLGGTNEGFDVPDYRDFYLSFRPGTGTGPAQSIRSGDLIPSFHRPELVNYVANLYGDPQSLSTSELESLLQWIGYACPRPLSIRLTRSGNVVWQSNVTFDGGRTPSSFRNSLDVDLDRWPGAEVAKVQEFVSWLIQGEWDVDNDLDGLADSVWLDPNLPLIATPDGKSIKALVSPLIEDLDGRININTAGDLGQLDPGFRLSTGDAFALGNGHPLPQGFGYGPADISFAHLLSPQRFATQATPFHLRYGWDGVPGVGGVAGDDEASKFFQRNQWSLHRHAPNAFSSVSGLPLGRRGGMGLGLDRFGNPLVVSNTFGGQVPSETENDPYESRHLTPSPQDSLFTLAELETVLRRFEASQATMPDRLNRVLQVGSGDSSIESMVYRAITTRSNEIRSPAIGIPTQSSASHLLEWIRQVHEERYRFKNRSGEPFQADAHDPALDLQTIRNLFPIDFRQGLRFHLNRPFGDGKDSDGDGQVDEPQELGLQLELESYPGGVTSAGNYAPGFAGSPSRLASRQLFARQLYVLAYLIVPRDYRFREPSA